MVGLRCILNPSEEVIAEYRAKAEAFAAQQAEWEKIKDQKYIKMAIKLN